MTILRLRITTRLCTQRSCVLGTMDSYLGFHADWMEDLHYGELVGEYGIKESYWSCTADGYLYGCSHAIGKATMVAVSVGTVITAQNILFGTYWCEVKISRGKIKIGGR